MKAYLRRKGPQDSSSWRPVKWYRVSAKRWVANLDAQLQGSTELPGLRYFRTAIGAPIVPFSGQLSVLGRRFLCGVLQVPGRALEKVSLTNCRLEFSWGGGP